MTSPAEFHQLIVGRPDSSLAAASRFHEAWLVIEERRSGGAKRGEWRRCRELWSRGAALLWSCGCRGAMDEGDHLSGGSGNSSGLAAMRRYGGYGFMLELGAEVAMGCQAWLYRTNGGIMAFFGLLFTPNAPSPYGFYQSLDHHQIIHLLTLPLATAIWLVGNLFLSLDLLFSPPRNLYDHFTPGHWKCTQLRTYSPCEIPPSRRLGPPYYRGPISRTVVGIQRGGTARRRRRGGYGVF